MIYNLRDEHDFMKFKSRILKLYEKGVWVELKERKKRSLKQNSYLHLILTAFAIESGLSVEDVKQWIFKRQVNADTFVVKKELPLLGKVEYLRSTATVSEEDMSTAIDRFKRFSAEQGIILPEPGEYEVLMRIEQEEKKNQEFL